MLAIFNHIKSKMQATKRTPNLNTSSQSLPDCSTPHSQHADLYINLSREGKTFFSVPKRTTLCSFHKISTKKCEAIHFVRSTFCCL